MGNQKFSPRYIYCLVDPRNEEIRYVGSSISPETRLTAHRFKSTVEKMYRWVGELKAEGLKPSLYILRKCTVKCYVEHEQWYMDTFRKSGCDLINSRPASRHLVDLIY